MIGVSLSNHDPLRCPSPPELSPSPPAPHPQPLSPRRAGGEGSQDDRSQDANHPLGSPRLPNLFGGEGLGVRGLIRPRFSIRFFNPVRITSRATRSHECPA